MGKNGHFLQKIGGDGQKMVTVRQLRSRPRGRQNMSGRRYLRDNAEAKTAISGRKTLFPNYEIPKAAGINTPPEERESLLRGRNFCGTLMIFGM